jgi:hypothetical protein
MVVTRTIGWPVSASHGGGSAGGSRSQGPTRRMFGGQSERWYSNGSAVRYNTSGGAVNIAAAAGPDGGVSSVEAPC